MAEPGLAAPSTAPAFSTPDENILSHLTPDDFVKSPKRLSDTELLSRYEILQTASDLVEGGWSCIALQFPDSLLEHAPRVVELLQHELDKTPVKTQPRGLEEKPNVSRGVAPPNFQSLETSMNDVSLADQSSTNPPRRRLYILGDTSYGACCVDEIAAEHISAEVVVHYGRACLSPTARLPVIHVFTNQTLDHDTVCTYFRETYPDKEAKIILMADTMFNNHIPAIHARLQDQEGYRNIIAPEIIHDPSSLLPNRALPEYCKDNPEELKTHTLFHISAPPMALLLTLSSRIGSITIFPTDTTTSTPPNVSTSALLRRRYGLVTSLSAARIFGILINTLSVSSYQHAAAKIAKQIAAAGKKSYTFVVGKINAAKVANFAEVDGWVVIGCWESSLVEDDGFWKPVITPFELDILLKGDNNRVWTGEWRGGFDEQRQLESSTTISHMKAHNEGAEANGTNADEEYDDDESAPPEFDLRTGRYVSHSTPANSTRQAQLRRNENSTSLIKRAKGDLAIIGNEVSPGAEFLRTKRTWRGLGSDLQIEYEDDTNDPAAPSTLIAEGRSGIARGYANERNGETAS